MAITRLSTALPAPPVPAFTDLLAANASSGVVFKTLSSVTGGSTRDFSPSFNWNSSKLEGVAQIGAGLIGIANGLVISAGSGLTLNMTAGKANINGAVPFTAKTLALTPSQANIYIWGKHDGTITSVNGSTSPPNGTDWWVFLGSASTDASTITDVDLSGVVYIYGGMPFRQVADTGKPTDSPGATWMGITKTATGTYWWDGTKYHLLCNSLNFNQTIIASGESVYLPSDHQLFMFDSLTITGDFTIDGDFLIVGTDLIWA